MAFIRSSMYGLVSGLADSCPDKEAFLNDSLALTWRQVLRRTRNTAARFHAAGVKAGDTVLVFMPRCIDTPLITTALRALGAVAVLLAPEADNPKDRAFLSGTHRDPWYLSVRLPDLRWTLEKDGAAVSFFTGDPVPDDAVPPLRTETVQGEPSFIIYTAGSTGLNKGVVLTEYAMVNQARVQAAASDVRADDRCMCVFPMHHIAGNVVVIQALATSCSIFFASTRYPEYVAKAIGTFRCTRLESVPTFFMMISATARRSNVDISSLRVGVVAGASYSPEQFMTIEEVLGIRLYPSYGMTEMAPVICSPEPDAPIGIRARSVGRFAPGVEGVLKAPGGEAVTEPFKEGEICVKGYPLMLGYLEDDGSLDRPLDPEGFFHTGDLGYRDPEGNVYITGRCKDIIIRGGENLSCSRIATSVTRIPGVSDAVAVGIPDPKYGETVGILAVTDAYDHEGLMKAFEDVLRPCEMPAGLVITDTVPVNSAGKPDRKVIRRLLEDAVMKKVK
ncbi:MAG: acyl--CoA ligase [Lachnospiraceae bacterium]|nr:acyl--CoA ligase [Lachnospiraceae bacterium]